MIGYGANLQLVSVSQLLCDPVTKVLLIKFGGLAMTGVYEMANRMVLQFRALLVEGNRSIVPSIAALHEKNAAQAEDLYEQNYKLML